MIGAIEEGTARVINEPDVIVVVGDAGELALGPNRLAWGSCPGLLCLGREVEAAADFPALVCDKYTRKCDFSFFS